MPGNFSIEQPGIPLSATESEASIFSGTNNYPNGLTIEAIPLAWNQNPGIDNPKAASNDDGNRLYTHQIGNATSGLTHGWDIVSTSSLPQFFTNEDLGIDRASTKSYSQKFFIHGNYIFKCHRWSPYIGIGGELEFGDQDEVFWLFTMQKTLLQFRLCSRQLPWWHLLHYSASFM